MSSILAALYAMSLFLAALYAMYPFLTELNAMSHFLALLKAIHRLNLNRPTFIIAALNAMLRFKSTIFLQTSRFNHRQTRELLVKNSRDTYL